ncbi:ubiquinol-cytochrome C chaperone family protein [Gellertiella hungarica]|uniref:Cytochrome b pre-mRNA-processing protein 3 n=1 Tax=Gellertiella hungarica TaxID=1572859 RepID=A0A7W6J665_9HYPH|nr:ubiquinol-cytochrome C chaperone family protein [Gellertiella hungarica]MBB4065489.1 cytochrome b pre-mRNA-processing protein 3 [Gellertiella hungarica]
MIFGLFRNRKHNQAIMKRQYDALTTVSRDPVFFLDYDVPDTVMGRFEMVSIVMILFFRRTRKSDTSGQELAQEIVDAFFQDLDHAIRELGIGDPAVPKRMKKFAGMFYGRLESYAKALDEGDAAALAAALARNIHPGKSDAPDMRALADYMIEAEAILAAEPEDSLATGTMRFPAPGKKGA